MKSDIENTVQVSELIFPMVVSVRGIKSLNYVFDPETLQPWSRDVVEYNDIYRNITVLGSSVPNDNEIQDNELFRRLVNMERQLLEDYSVHAESLDGFDKSVQVKLQRYALIINLAKCWEDWAFKMHAMIKQIDETTADKQVKYVYLQYVIPLYREALENLTYMGNPLPHNITNTEKYAWGKMAVYTQNKFITTLSLYDDKDSIEGYKNMYKHGGDLLVNNGLGYLVPDYIPEVEAESHILSDAKDIIWSAWKNMYGYVCSPSHTAYEQIHQQPEHIEHKIAPNTPEMSRNDTKQPTQSDNPDLRQRKVKPPEI